MTTEQCSYENQLKTWFIKDDKLLVKSLDKSVHEIADEMQREPIEILLHLMDERAQEYLAKEGFHFEFDRGTEEEAELFGLALAGVPLGPALLWCAAAPKRPTAQELQSMMTGPDMRPAMNQVRELGIWFSKASELEDLQFLEETMPEEITQAAIEDLLEKFQPPTPSVIRMYVEGELPEDKAPYKRAVAKGPHKNYTSKYASKSPRKSTGSKWGKRSYRRSYRSKSGYAKKSRYA